jgi:hypothetical protein
MLVISDWSNVEDKNSLFPVGDLIKTTQKEYETRMKEVLSQNFCLYYAQAFERLETFLKNCIYDKACKDTVFNEWFIGDGKLERKPFPNKRKLYCSLKKAGSQAFRELSANNINGFKFKAIWEVFSEVRHAITHNSSVLEISKVTKNQDQSRVLNSFFSYQDLDSEIKITFTYPEFDHIIKHVAEFAFQVFKSLSTEDGFSWDPKVNKL